MTSPAILALGLLIGFILGLFPAVRVLQKRWTCTRCGDYGANALCLRCAPQETTNTTLYDVEVKARREGREERQRVLDEVDAEVVKLYDTVVGAPLGLPRPAMSTVAIVREVLKIVKQHKPQRQATIEDVQQAVLQQMYDSLRVNTKKEDGR